MAARTADGDKAERDASSHKRQSETEKKPTGSGVQLT
jgi:hypothetical protein